MTLSEQIDKFANETRDTVDIICRIAKRQGKEEALEVIEDIKAEIEHMETLVTKFEVLRIIEKHTKGE